MIINEVSLTVDRLNIAGQIYLPGAGRYPAVCVCHGIPSGSPPEPGDRGYPALAEEICRHGLAVLIFNFRGTGNSQGNMDMLGWARDLRAAIDYLYQLPVVDKARIALLGYSGGAAVSVFVASADKRVACVIAAACPAEFNFFENAGGAASIAEHYRAIGAIRDDDFPGSAEEWLDGFQAISPIKHIAGIAPQPLLLVHGSADDLVDVEHARRLYDRAGEPKELVIIEGSGHRLRRDERAVTIITDWINSRLLE